MVCARTWRSDCRGCEINPTLAKGTNRLDRRGPHQNNEATNYNRVRVMNAPLSTAAAGYTAARATPTVDRQFAELFDGVDDLIKRVVDLYPDNFVGVCQLPQSPGASMVNSAAELERCISELGFIGCNLNPDPSGGKWTSPPLTDRYWYSFYEKMVDLDVPAMVHVSSSCNPNFHATGAHYINADTTAFMQFIQSDLFKDFPTLRFIIPHGGGAVPYHWGRYRGLAQDMKRPPLKELLLNNIYFDTCVYHQLGIDLLAKVIPADNILFASEMVGAVKSIDPETGHYFDDTKRYIDGVLWLSAEDKRKIFEGNALKVYSRLAKQISRQSSSARA